MVREKDFFQSDRFLGASFQSLPVDQSEKRLCEARCMGLLDDMNNWAGAKYLLAEGDTYMKYPDDETFPQLVVNYVKLDRVPKFNDGWTPVVDALRAGNFFVTSGEVLIRDWSVEGAGAKRTYTAEAEWTFPPEFAELVWSDGKTVDRQMIDMAEMAPVQQSQIPHSVRRHRQEVGALCRLGFGRQRRIHAAGPPEMTNETKPPRRIGRSIGAVLAGIITGVVFSLGTDLAMRSTGVFPALGQPISDTALPAGDSVSHGLQRGGKLRHRATRAQPADAARADPRRAGAVRDDSGRGDDVGQRAGIWTQMVPPGTGRYRDAMCVGGREDLRNAK